MAARATRLEGEIEIRRSVDEVFAFVADPHNDPLWCPRVESCRQTGGEAPGPAARYEVVHSPTFQRRHQRRIEIAEFHPPHRLVSEQSDDIADFTITYSLSPAETGTRLHQLDEIRWRIAPPFRPVGRMVVRRHIGDQLRRLKALLET